MSTPPQSTPVGVYALNWAVRTLLTALLTELGLVGLAMLLYPWPVARYWWRGQRAYAVGMLASAAVGVGFVAELPLVALAVGFALLGAVAGHALLRQWTFGRCVAALTGGAFGMQMVNNLMNWADVREAMAAISRMNVSQLEQMQAEQGVSLQAQLDMNRWLLEHFDYVSFGLLFGGTFIMCCAATALVGWLARGEGLALRGGFATMRPPDWLVWVAIAVALVALADYHWPNRAAQLFAWNTGLGLSAIYWMNGVACLVYLATVMQSNLLLVVVLVTAVLLPPVLPYFALLGFFDTWLELRKKADRLAEKAAQNRP